MILENRGYPGKDFDERKLEEKIAAYPPDKSSIPVLRRLLLSHRDSPGFAVILKEKCDIDLVFHQADGKKPYGYSIIDHETKQVFKGSEVLSLNHLVPDMAEDKAVQQTNGAEEPVTGLLYVPAISIAADINDEDIHQRNRRRKKTPGAPKR
jgi:hypothetical protein